ncbi:MAG: GNAT family N-acetyltransferase [Reyranella sp.]|uniref:GNAT family N-acetyltransferase n=1 Tax=Reyranella sp. TaxID=1929291 RepID=UPI003D0C19BF
MTTLAVDAATAAEEAAVVDTLMLAFASDPATRWTWPDPSAYLRAFPRFARAFGGAAFAHGSAFRLGTAGAALWLPPGIGPDDQAMMALMQATASPESMIDGMQVMQQMASCHPHEPHWYLPLIGVDPAWQGKGVGSRLMKHATNLFDRDGALAYLESSNPRNIPLYQRHGFEILGHIQAGSSPTITPMLRKPR